MRFRASLTHRAEGRGVAVIHFLRDMGLLYVAYEVAVFLRNTPWVLYALYFAPTKLSRRLREGLDDLDADADPRPLYRMLGELGQPAGRRYLLRMSIFCTLSVMVFLLLAPFAPRPPGCCRPPRGCPRRRASSG